MKLLLLSAFILFSFHAHNSVGRKISIKPIGWQFSLSNRTIFKDSTFDSEGKLTEEVPSFGPSLKLFTIQDSSFGTFSAFLKKDSMKISQWKERHDSDSKWYFEQIAQIPQVKLLETKYFTRTIDSVIFLVQYVKYLKNESTDTVYVYHQYGRIKAFELDISYGYTDKLVGEKYRDIINKSKFAK